MAVTFLPACHHRKSPILEPLRALPSRTPVVLVPGIIGTTMKKRTTGRTVWGDARSLFLPRDGAYSMAIPLEEEGGDKPRPYGSVEPRAVPAGPLLGFRILGIRKVEAYGSFVRLMEQNGYRYGDLAGADPDADFFIHAYDWRKSSITAARELAAKLEALRLARGEETLTVDLICQSNAGRICRYLSRFGAASLEEAEGGTHGPPHGLRVRKLILVGTANGGSVRTLRELHRGRSYVNLVGRKFRPEVFFTFTSVYEGLPLGDVAVFIDRDGNRIDLDLLDPDEWKKYGWSIFGDQAAQRVRRSGRTDLFAGVERQCEFLADSLERAARFQGLLRKDSEMPEGIRYYMVQNPYEETPAGAVLVEEQGKWKMYFSGDRFLRRNRYLRTGTGRPRLSAVPDPRRPLQDDPRTGRPAPDPGVSSGMR